MRQHHNILLAKKSALAGRRESWSQYFPVPNPE
jgi:hypothetical protein